MATSGRESGLHRQTSKVDNYCARRAVTARLVTSHLVDETYQFEVNWHRQVASHPAELYGGIEMAVKGKERPVRKGARYQLEISGLGHSGEGVARADNFTVFVEDGLPGDTVTAVVTEVKKNYGRAKLVQVDKPSPYRITPQCSVHASCGGCQLQTFDYSRQLEWKQRRVEEEITRIGGLAGVTVLPVIGMDTPFAYRNKAQYPVQKDAEGRIVLGFYAKGTHKVVEAPQGCFIDHPLNTKAIRAAAFLLNQLNASVYDEQTGVGLFRHIVARTSAARGEVMLVLVTNGMEIPQQQQLLSSLREAVPELVSIAQNINTANTNVIFGRETKLLWGRPTIQDTIGHLTFEISPRSFFQVNPVQTEVLYQKAKEYAGLSGIETVVDGYCGIGTIALFVADQAERVIGIEDVPEAIADAKRNAAYNDIDNAEFFADRVETRLPALVESGLRPDVVILDPPRRGVDPAVLDAVAAAGVSRLVYVSCNPSSLARDLAYLDRVGYETRMVQPVDMFPHTSHVECVVLLER